MWLYIFQEDVNQYLKIGFTSDIKRRQAQLQQGNPRPLRLVYEILFDPSKVRWAESLIHARLRECRRMGEWFEVNLEFVKATLLELL